MPEELIDRFLRTGPCRILVGLLEGTDHYMTSLTRDADMTYSHVVKLLLSYEEYGLIETTKEGRERKVALTPYGQRVARQVQTLIDVLVEPIK